MAELTRRQVARTAAWSVPVLAVGIAAPAASASTTDQTCPGVFAGPVGSWLTSDGFVSYGEWTGGAAWYIDLSLTFHSEYCGFGSDYATETAVSGVTVHTEQAGATGTRSPLAHTALNSFADHGVCADTLTMAMGGNGDADLFTTRVDFLYIISGLPGQGDTPCSVPITATLTYPAGAEGNDAKGSVVIS